MFQINVFLSKSLAEHLYLLQVCIGVNNFLKLLFHLHSHAVCIA